ncbi:MAG: hypothetical protein OXH77_12485 [Anaerolineaceae bacterium]|nr:hypothetical protein [Anaerolineaceae bacterium]
MQFVIRPPWDDEEEYCRFSSGHGICFMLPGKDAARVEKFMSDPETTVHLEVDGQEISERMNLEQWRKFAKLRGFVREA